MKHKQYYWNEFVEWLEFTHDVNFMLPNIFPSNSLGILDKMSADGKTPTKEATMRKTDTFAEYIFTVEDQNIE